jgi:hypothetical protein
MFAASYRLTPQERSLGAHRHASTGTRLR